VLPDARVIVSDDGSTDGTRDVVLALAASGKPITLIARSGRPCLTGSIQDGIDAARSDYVAWMDADLSHPAALLPALLDAARGPGCAIASRFAVGGKQKKSGNDTPDSPLAIVLSGILNFMVHRWLRLDVSDYTSGFIVCRRALLEPHRLVGDYGEYFIELMYYLSRSGVRVAELAYESPPRVWGESKTGTSLGKLVRRGIKYLWLTVRLHLPRSVFGDLSLEVRRPTRR
jgi:dolichol-phosphate mannosyltransferase